MNGQPGLVGIPSDPILVIGMHRSGTRLVADLLAALGVFMGRDRQADSESVMFLRLNEAILHQCGAFWSEPMPAHFVLADPATVAQLATGLRQALAEQWPQYTGEAGPAAVTGRPFGWKDPRNTFTLPVWQQLFGDLRVVHALRHGVDVAASLSRRHRAALRSASASDVPDALTVVRDDALGVLSSRRGWTLSEALTMWEQYVEKARMAVRELGAERALELRFEFLLDSPRAAIDQLAAFCGTATADSDEAVLASIDAERGRAYRDDPVLAAFAHEHRAILERFGYAP